MTCREVADFILAYSTGELSDGVREIFDRHLSVCPNCREYLAQYLMTVQLGRHAFDADATAVESGVPEELVTAILAARPR
jgi:anti-sigma factor RsiW